VAAAIVALCSTNEVLFRQMLDQGRGLSFASIERGRETRSDGRRRLVVGDWRVFGEFAIETLLIEPKTTGEVR
jgi:hypothetical protein